ncbi:Double zinc ribbon [uncultured archaeon]|nr:Double zinc ribbon [uncultured archaeon]
MGLLDALGSAFGFSKSGSDTWMDCPDCGTRIHLGMERCPKCGTHIDSMFRLKCPHCKTENPLRAKVCEKCKKPLQMPGGSGGGGGGGQIYTCPRCGFRANYFMTSCPECGVKFA